MHEFDMLVAPDGDDADSRLCAAVGSIYRRCARGDLAHAWANTAGHLQSLLELALVMLPPDKRNELLQRADDLGKDPAMLAIVRGDADRGIV